MPLSMAKKMLHEEDKWRHLKKTATGTPPEPCRYGDGTCLTHSGDSRADHVLAVRLGDMVKQVDRLNAFLAASSPRTPPVAESNGVSSEDACRWHDGPFAAGDFLDGRVATDSPKTRSP
jgi:hypothetical protein